MGKGAIQQKPKDRPRKQRIKAKLKFIVEEYNKPIAIALWLLTDFLEDGQIDGFGIGAFLD